MVLTRHKLVWYDLRLLALLSTSGLLCTYQNPQSTTKSERSWCRSQCSTKRSDRRPSKRLAASGLLALNLPALSVPSIRSPDHDHALGRFMAASTGAPEAGPRGSGLGNGARGGARRAAGQGKVVGEGARSLVKYHKSGLLQTLTTVVWSVPLVLGLTAEQVRPPTAAPAARAASRSEPESPTKGTPSRLTFRRLARSFSMPGAGLRMTLAWSGCSGA